MLALAFFIAAHCFVTPSVHAEDNVDRVVDIEIINYRFTPGDVIIKAGDHVRWTNHEKRTSHSILFAAEGLPESERLFPGESWERAFKKAGLYPYSCGPHPEMKGIVRVE